MTKTNRYSLILERIFRSRFTTGTETLDFAREEIVRFAEELGIRLPKNIGDIIYTFRYRAPLPEGIREVTPKGKTWIIRGIGPAKYRFVLTPDLPLAPNPNLSETKIPDATPGVVAKYALSDEQALLARLRYNRLVDIFTGITCYSLQNHLRTNVREIGQIETDELYVGVDQKGSHYMIPIQAKGGNDQLNVVQIEQDTAMCATKHPSLICRPLGAQFMPDNVIALFEFEQSDVGISIVSERHYRLVPPDDVTEGDLVAYKHRP